MLFMLFSELKDKLVNARTNYKSKDELRRNIWDLFDSFFGTPIPAPPPAAWDPFANWDPWAN